MKALTRAELWTLEEYARRRPQFRAEVLAHKKNRKLHLGEHATLYFEDRLTIQYQIQEMLRIERIFEEQGIQGELDAYNPLIPDGHNWKATFMIEYADPEERMRALRQLLGIEQAVWMQVDGHPRISPLADEDLDRTTEEKTSAVHFVRFDPTPEMIRSIHAGADIAAGIDHPRYQVCLDRIPQAVRDALASDLDLA